MNVLFVHQNFPGQYPHLAQALAQQGHRVIGLGEKANLQNRPDLPGVTRIGYPTPQSGHPNTHQYLRDFEGQVRRGQQIVRSLLNLKNQGFVPDLIYAHPGWGELLYIKDVYPQVPLVGLFEFYYHGRDQDVGFDPEFAAQPLLELDSQCRIRTKNVNNLLALEAVDLGICPTHYQKSVMPIAFQDKLTVIHDGINTNVAVPDPRAQLSLPSESATIALDHSTEVITFVNRNLEPYRGYHTFMRCLPRLLQERPQAQVVLVGGDGVSYGAAAPSNQTWKATFLQEVQTDLDLTRVHFVGRVPYSQLIQLFQVSSVHVYLTYPFVLSWSMLEAMSCGCLVVGSRTPPVEELIRAGENGLLVDFFDSNAIVDQINAVMTHPTRMQSLRAAARRTIVENYDLQTVCLPQQLALIQQILSTAAAGFSQNLSNQK
ncbi:MAG: glycosyltransferase family 4 protein [Leptolyngbyaceae cyanobacterium]